MSGRTCLITTLFTLILAVGCDPAQVEKAKHEAAAKAGAAKDATTQAAEDLKQTVKPYVDKGVAKAKETYQKGKQKAGELAEKTKPYLRKAKRATTQAVEDVKRATTQAIEKFRDDSP